MARSNKAILIASTGFALLFGYQNCSPVSFESIDAGLATKAGALEDGVKGEIIDVTNDVVIREPAEAQEDAAPSSSDSEMSDDDKKVEDLVAELTSPMPERMPSKEEEEDEDDMDDGDEVAMPQPEVLPPAVVSSTVVPSAEQTPDVASSDAITSAEPLPQPAPAPVVNSPAESEAIALCENLKKKSRKLMDAPEGTSLSNQRGCSSLQVTGLATVKDVRGNLKLIAKVEGAEIASLEDVRGNVFICGMNVKSLKNSNGNVVIVGGNVGDVSNFKGNLRIVGGSVTGSVVNSVGSYFAKNP